jgi:hypothetical protein
MKKIMLSAVLAIFTVVTFTECKKSDNKSTPVVTSMTATINGLPFSGSLSVYALNGSSIEIDGGNQNTQNNLTLQLVDPYIRLYIDNYMLGTLGDFTFGSGTSAASGSIDSNSAMGAYVVGHTGTITITVSTPSAVKGTFNFVSLDGTTVTNGAFTAKPN